MPTMPASRALGLAIAVWCLAAAAGLGQARRPNILFIFSDDHTTRAGRAHDALRTLHAFILSWSASPGVTRQTGFTASRLRYASRHNLRHRSDRAELRSRVVSARHRRARVGTSDALPGEHDFIDHTRSNCAASAVQSIWYCSRREPRCNSPAA